MLPSPDPLRRRLLQALACAFAAGLAPRAARAQGTPFALVYADAFAPYSMRIDGRIRGIFVDIAEELLVHRLGLAVNHAGYPWARAQMLVRQGQADAFISVATAERRAYTEPTAEWLTEGRLVMLARADDPERERLAAIDATGGLAGLEVGTYLGNDWAIATLEGLAVRNAPNRTAALQMLLAGRLRIVVDASGSARAALREAGLQQRIVELPHALARNETRLCIGRHSALLAHRADIDRALGGMKADGTLARLSESGVAAVPSRPAD